MAANGQLFGYDKETSFPFQLQDFCLMTIINELDSYPVDWLALLPLQIRHHLLTNLPILDLCRLDHTSVADGIDIDNIWKSIRPIHITSEKCNLSNTKLFMTRPDNPSFIGDVDEIVDLEPELLVASHKDKNGKGNRETYLLQATANTLYEVRNNFPDTNILKDTVSHLTSMRGDLQEMIGAVLRPNTKHRYAVSKTSLYHLGQHA